MLEGSIATGRAKTAILFITILALGCGLADMQDGQLPAKRAEVPVNVNGIRTAQLAHDSAYSGFVAQTTPTPRAPRDLTPQAVPWVPAKGFEALAWSPDGDVRGAYWVELTDGGEDFIVHGVIDADGDGAPAHYTATKNTVAAAITPPDVY